MFQNISLVTYRVDEWAAFTLCTRRYLTGTCVTMCKWMFFTHSYTPHYFTNINIHDWMQSPYAQSKKLKAALDLIRDIVLSNVLWKHSTYIDNTCRIDLKLFHYLTCDYSHGMYKYIVWKKSSVPDLESGATLHNGNCHSNIIYKNLMLKKQQQKRLFLFLLQT